MNWTLRLARADDVPELAELIPLSVRKLQAAYYSTAQIEAALGPVFAVDRQLIVDGTYFIAEKGGQIVGAGGWSRRDSHYGGDAGRVENALLDPRSDPARVRAFFVHPAWARRGIGQGILTACEAAILEADFYQAELVATLAGEPLYASRGYDAVQRFEIPLANGMGLPVVRMVKQLKEK